MKSQNPNVEPIKARITTNSSSWPFHQQMTPRQDNADRRIPDARPSSPSMRFIAFITLTIQITVSGKDQKPKSMIYQRNSDGNDPPDETLLKMRF